jgi:uncharacterized membrane protein YbhN (UPF0104 family)
MRMSSNVVGDVEATRSSLAGGVGKVAVFAAKLAVTAACFWYVSRQINLGQVLSAIPLLDFRWAAFATALVMLQIPLVAMRWRNILDALASLDERTTRTAITAITAMAVFFAQVLPGAASDGLRAWMAVRLGCDWRHALTSVMIDRGVGVGLLVAIGFVTLLWPSDLTALGGYGHFMLAAYGALLLVGVVGLLLVPKVLPWLERFRYSRWVAAFAADAHTVLLGRGAPAILGLGCAVHALTIVMIWSLARAQGITLTPLDASVLFTVMIGVAIVPISISGWGLRELAVVQVLGGHGVAPEKALLFSVCFGLAVAIGSLPGVLAWLVYSAVPAPAPRPAERIG